MTLEVGFEEFWKLSFMKTQNVTKVTKENFYKSSNVTDSRCPVLLGSTNIKSFVSVSKIRINCLK